MAYVNDPNDLSKIKTKVTFNLTKLPAFLLAVYERDGLPLEKVLYNLIRAKYLRTGVQLYRTENIYAPFAGKEEPVKLVTEMLGAPQRETVKEEPIANKKSPKARPHKG